MDLVAKTRTKRFEVAALLEKAILLGRFPPGTRLREQKLAGEMGVSQASVREGLQQLESMGLVVKYPNHGSFVIDLTPIDLVHLYEVRRELEPLASARAAATIGDEELRAMRECLNKMQAFAGRRDFRAFSNADLEFHRVIWHSQPNRHLENSLEATCVPLFAYDMVRRCSTAHINFEQTVRQHRRIWTAMQTGDSVLVAKLVRRLLDRFLRESLAAFERLQQVSEAQAGSLQEPLGELSLSNHPTNDQ